MLQISQLPRNDSVNPETTVHRRAANFEEERSILKKQDPF